MIQESGMRSVESPAERLVGEVGDSYGDGSWTLVRWWYVAVSRPNPDGFSRPHHELSGGPRMGKPFSESHDMIWASN